MKNDRSFDPLIDPTTPMIVRRICGSGAGSIVVSESIYRMLVRMMGEARDYAAKKYGKPRAGYTRIDRSQRYEEYGNPT
jgi:hypothetical protein